MKTPSPHWQSPTRTHRMTMAHGLLLAVLLTASPLMVEAGWAKKTDIPQQSFLPPVASINPKITPDAPQNGEGGEDVEPVTLSAITTPILKPKAPILKLDNDLGIQTSDGDFQTLLKLQRTLDDEDLNKLWQATVEKNPVIRFSLEKLATPTDLHLKKSSQFLNKTLNLMISGAAMATTMLPGPGASGYRNMATMAGGDAIKNVINGRTQPQAGVLTPAEQIQLANLVDQLQGRLVHTYHDYKNTLQALSSAHQVTLKNNNLYSKALASGNDFAALAAGSGYYKALLSETDLRQKAKLYRLQLERLAGPDAVSDLRLSLSVSGDITQEPSTSEGKTASAARKSVTKTDDESFASPHSGVAPMPPYGATPEMMINDKILE